MRLPGTVLVGIFALFLGILVYVPVYYWVNTRTLTPVDVPVSFASSHIRTGDFRINVESYFSVQIRFPYSGGSECRYADSLRTRQLTSIGGQAISAPGVPAGANGGVTNGTYLGSFRGKPGHYNLDIEVLSRTQEFDRCQPRLLIEASPYDFNQWDAILSAAFSFCVFCELLGVTILLVFATTRFRAGSLEEVRLRILDSDAPAGPVPPANLEPRRSFPLLLVFGIFGVAAGIVVFAATKHWYDARGFVLVEMPVSLGRGHIKTGDFTTNLKGTYDIAFDTQVPSIAGCLQYAVLKTRWAVTQNGRIVAHRERGGYYWKEPDAPIEGMNLYNFDAEPGTYDLDVEILSDGSCLNIGKPRLRVYLSDSDRIEYDELNTRLQLVSLLSVGMGFAFLFAYRFARLRQQTHALPLSAASLEQKPMWGVTGLRYRRFPASRAWAMNPVLNIPTLALVCSLTWFTWLMPAWIVYAGVQRSSCGLSVSLPRKEVPTVAIAPGLTAPLVKIESRGRAYLNYKETSWERLAADLDEALRGLPIRVVYVDGDRDILFMEVVRAIDIIQGSGARAILITPGSKAKI